MGDYSQIPQRSQQYPATDRARDLVRSSMAIDTLYSGIWPTQWSSPQAPEFHHEMDRLIEAGFKAIAACTAADGAGTSLTGVMQATQFYLKKINERPDRYQVVRTSADIDAAVAEGRLGIFFTNQGTSIFEGDPDRVAFWRELGYGYCLLAYNGRNPYGDGCFEPDNGHLTTVGKLLIEAYNHYGMVVDVSHTGERTSLDAIEHSTQPVISSHSVALAIADYPRSLSDEVIKAIAESGGVCSINMVGGFVDTTNPDIVTTDTLFRHIDYMAELVGIDHVGFASDYIPDVTWTADSIQLPMGQVLFPDGGYSAAMGAKGIPTPAPSQIIAALLDTMLEHGYNEEDCAKFIGGNAYRVFQQVWK